MSVTVIISAYGVHSPLDKALIAYSVQSLMPDEIIIAEDGMNKEISALVKKFSPLFKIPLIHLTQHKNGFRKNCILNKAVAASIGKLLIFTDQDILPRKDFIAMHVSLCKPHSFISGGSHLNIKASYHEKFLTYSDITNQNIFNVNFIKQHTSFNFRKTRLTTNKFIARLLDSITPRNVFIGCNSSVYRKNILKVNGFDESMAYGGGDVNLGIRLNNQGYKGKRYMHSLVCLHLEHQRPYKDTHILQQNRKYNKNIKLKKETQPKKSIFL